MNAELALDQVEVYCKQQGIHSIVRNKEFGLIWKQGIWKNLNVKYTVYLKFNEGGKTQYKNRYRICLSFKQDGQGNERYEIRNYIKENQDSLKKYINADLFEGNLLQENNGDKWPITLYQPKSEKLEEWAYNNFLGCDKIIEIINNYFKDSKTSKDNIKNNVTDVDYRDYSEGKVNISVDEWKNIFNNDIFNDKYIDILVQIYNYSPEHAASAKELEIEYNSDQYNTYNLNVGKMGILLQEKLSLPTLRRWVGSPMRLPHLFLGKRLKNYKNIRVTKFLKPMYWPYLFLGKKAASGMFSWKMRPELAQAFEDIYANLIETKKVEQDKRRIKKVDNNDFIELAKKYKEITVKEKTTTVKQYNRSVVVIEFARRMANGICQLCDNDAPFLNKEGEPFLEVHHINELANGGSDSFDNVIALCPNCHRKIHILKDEDDREFLASLARDYCKNYFNS